MQRLRNRMLPRAVNSREPSFKEVAVGARQDHGPVKQIEPSDALRSSIDKVLRTIELQNVPLVSPNPSRCCMHLGADVLTFYGHCMPSEEFVADFHSALDHELQALPQRKEWDNVSPVDHNATLSKQKYSPFPPTDGTFGDGSLSKPFPEHNRRAGDLNPMARNRGQVAGRTRQGGEEQGSEERSDKDDSYELRPPTPKQFSDTVAGIADTLFSTSHLLQILHDKATCMAFALFLHRHAPNLSLVLDRYLANRKALAAIAYANAIVSAQHPIKTTFNARVAAVADPNFLREGQDTFDRLLLDALPAFITFQLIKEVTERLPLQISTMKRRRESVAEVEGVSEVFCLTDPNSINNPIIYASREFFRLTQYGKEYAIGRNCSFLQGPGTSPDTIGRLRRAIRDGKEVSETILNYRRDGSPFLNLMMLSPLYDDQGHVRYFIGAQMDVSRLIDNAQGLEGYRRCRMQSSTPSAASNVPVSGEGEKESLVAAVSPISHAKRDQVGTKLKDLFEMLAYDESARLQTLSLKHQPLPQVASFTKKPESLPQKRVRQHGPQRLYLGDLSATPPNETHEAPPPPLPPQITSGSLPSVYEDYLLVRPLPSLRIIFASPAMRRGCGQSALLQSHLFSHMTCPSNSVLRKLTGAFKRGVPVTGMVMWSSPTAGSPESSPTGTYHYSSDGSETLDYSPEEMPWSPGSRLAGGSTSRDLRWLSATPLVGSDGQPGIWMVVIIKDPYGTEGS